MLVNDLYYSSRDNAVYEVQASIVPALRIPAEMGMYEQAVCLSFTDSFGEEFYVNLSRSDARKFAQEILDVCK